MPEEYSRPSIRGDRYFGRRHRPRAGLSACGIRAGQRSDRSLLRGCVHRVARPACRGVRSGVEQLLPAPLLPAAETGCSTPDPSGAHSGWKLHLDRPGKAQPADARYVPEVASTRDSPELVRPALRRGRGNRRSRLELGFSRGRTLDARYGPGVRVLAGSCPTSRRILWIVGVRGGTWRKRVRRQAVLLMLLTLTQRFRRLSMVAVATRALRAANSKNLYFSLPDACPVPVKSGIAGGPRRSPEVVLNRGRIKSRRRKPPCFLGVALSTGGIYH